MAPGAKHHVRKCPKPQPRGKTRTHVLAETVFIAQIFGGILIHKKAFRTHRDHAKRMNFGGSSGGGEMLTAGID